MNVLINGSRKTIERISPILTALCARVESDDTANPDNKILNGQDLLFVEMDGERTGSLPLCDSSSIPVVLVITGYKIDWEKIYGLNVCGFINLSMDDGLLKNYLKAITRRFATVSHEAK